MPMVSFLPRCLVSLMVFAACAAHATPDRPFGLDDLQRNGAVSRHLWAPADAIIDIAGHPVSAGIAIGLRGGLRSNLGVAVAPALSMRIGERSSMSLLAGGNGAVMLVLQTRP